MAMSLRNYPPEHGIRVPEPVQESFAVELLLAAGMEDDGARLVAGLLTGNDCRCVFSHGTRALHQYITRMGDGGVNPRPQVRVERDDGATAVIDGDGGLGYHACHVGMTMAIEKAKALGVGAATTCNHHHFGAAGLWTRMALAQDCVGLAISTHRYQPNTDGMILGAAGGSPISIAIPAGAQPPLVLDMSASFLPRTEELMAQFPAAFFKGLGLSATNVILGGILAGIWRPQATQSQFESNQGSFLTAWDVAHFMDLEEFRAEMDRYVGQARQMEPFPGMVRAELPGGNEWQWERDSAERGIPVSDGHREVLEKLAADAGITSPYADYEGTRF